MFVNTTYLKYIIEKQKVDIREFNVKLQQLESKVNSNNSDDNYVKTNLEDFRSNSDTKGLVNYTWQNASDNNSVLTFNFKGKNIELDNLPYEGDINETPDLSNEFVAGHNIIYGNINTAIASSSTTIDEYNKYKIDFDGKLVLPEYSAGLFFIGYDDIPSHMKYCKEIDLTNVDMNNIINASCIFRSCYGLTSLDLSKFTGENVTNASFMFESCTGLTTLNLSNFTGASLTNAFHMFSNCSGLTSLDLSEFTGENVINTDTMFEGCTGLTTLNLSNFTGENVTNAPWMFHRCTSLTSLDLSKFTGENLTNINTIFANCSRLSLFSLPNFTGENVTDATNMFANCSRLSSLDLSRFTGENLASAPFMFVNCSSLTTLIMKGSAINQIISLENSYLSLDTGVTVDNDKTYRCTCTYDDDVKITDVTVI